MQMKSLSFISDLEKFGRKMKDNLYEVGITDLTPVHDIFPALSFCSCQRNCKSILCKCEKKNNLTCTEICSPTNHEKVLQKRNYILIYKMMISVFQNVLRILPL